MIKHYSLNLLQQALNRILGLDPNLQEQLAILDSKVLKIIIMPLNIHFFITFQEKRLVLLLDYIGQPDTVIQSTPLGFIRLSLLPASKARSLFNDNIQISGDIELGETVKHLFDSLDIDWETHLANFTGDVVAFQIGNTFRKAASWKNRLVSTLQVNVTEYLQEEQNLLPPTEAVADFFKDVDTLVHDVERLEAHIQLLLKNS